jgi:hypothetical protein
MDAKPQPCVSDLNDEPIFPRIGKLSLGIKTEAGNGNSHPRNIDYFRFHCRSEVLVKRFLDLYGERPAAVRICLLSENIDKVFPNNLTWYSGMVLRCTGDNETARRMWKDVEPEIQQKLEAPASPFTKVTIPCPCPRKGNPCTLKGRFNVMLPEIQPAAKFEVNTGSIVNLKEIRGVLRSYKEMLGRISFVPFMLSRHPVRMQYEGKSAVQYLLQLLYEGDMTAINDLRTSCGLPALPFSVLIKADRPMAISPPKEGADTAENGTDAGSRNGERTQAGGSNSAKNTGSVDTEAIDNKGVAAAQVKKIAAPAAIEPPGMLPEPPVAVGTEGPRAVIPKASIALRPPEASAAQDGGTSAKPAETQSTRPKATPAEPAGGNGVSGRAAQPDPRPTGTPTGSPSHPVPPSNGKTPEPAKAAATPGPGLLAEKTSTGAGPTHGPASSAVPGSRTAPKTVRPGDNGTSARPAASAPCSSRPPAADVAPRPPAPAGAWTPNSTSRAASPTGPAPAPGVDSAGPTGSQVVPRCTKCQDEVSERVAEYSKSHHGAALCMGCQKQPPGRA